MTFLLDMEQGSQFKYVSDGGFLSTNNAAWILVVVLVVALLFAALVIMRMRRDRWQSAGMASAPEEVFVRLCEANSLTRHQIFLLREMLGDLKLENPVVLFVCPQLYEQYAGMLDDNRKPLIFALRETLFG